MQLFNSRVPTPLAWYGGKSLMLDFILPNFPAHRVYCEPFGGSAALMFAKAPSAVEVYNDINPGLVNFFTVVKDGKLMRNLYTKLMLTPNSRQEHAQCKRAYPSPDPVECARQFFVLTRQSFSAIEGAAWGYTIQTRGGSFRSAVNLIPGASCRLGNVVIEKLDFADLFDRYDGPDVLWYLDPPYLADARVSKEVYQHELADDDQLRLLNHITRLKGMVVLSGYPSKLYEDYLRGWKTITKSVRCFSSPNSLKPERIECLWFNPTAWKARRPGTRRVG